MSENRSNADISLKSISNDSEQSRLLVEEEFTPAEIADNPSAAENFNIEKRFLNVAQEKNNNSPMIGVINSEDSFDWLEDDKDLYEITRGMYTGPPVTLKSKSSLYDNVQPDNPQSIRSDEGRNDPDSDCNEESNNSLLPKKLYYTLILFVQVLLLSISFLGIWGYDLGLFGGLPLHYWSLIGSLVVFVPFLGYWFLKLLVKSMRHSGGFADGELTNFIDSLRTPIVMLTTTLIVFTFWFKYFPRGCPLNDNPLSICFYDFADKIFYGLLIVSIGFSIEIIIMFFATLKFHERTFKNRIINCRFKIYIVQQLALKGLDADAAQQRTQVSGLDSNRIMASASRDNINEIQPNDESTYIGELINFFRGTSSRSQRVLGNAANFVQIQIEDRAATVPVTHSSSQSYEKFSSKLKKHMKLYGYSQFAQNKTGLKDNEARVLAKDLFNFICPAGKNFLTIDDLAPFFASNQAKNDAYEIFDQDQDGKISKKEFRNAIISIYSELRDVTQSIRSSGSALQKLDIILKMIFIAGMMLVLMTIFSFNVTNTLTLTLSVVIGLNFIIGDLAKHFLDSLVLLFINHPFDIGDTIVVGLFEEGCYLKDILTVKQINLMTTVFTRWNGQETYVPNHMLAGAPFMTNLSRTVEQWEMIEFKVPSLASESALVDLRKNIGSFLQMNDTYYYKVFDMHAIVAADMGNSEKNLDELEFNLRVKCKPTSDAQKRWARHAKLLKFIKITLEGSFNDQTVQSNNQ